MFVPPLRLCCQQHTPQVAHSVTLGHEMWSMCVQHFPYTHQWYQHCPSITLMPSTASSPRHLLSLTYPCPSDPPEPLALTGLEQVLSIAAVRTPPKSLTWHLQFFTKIFPPFTLTPTKPLHNDSETTHIQLLDLHLRIQADNAEFSLNLHVLRIMNPGVPGILWAQKLTNFRPPKNCSSLALHRHTSSRIATWLASLTPIYLLIQHNGAVDIQSRYCICPKEWSLHPEVMQKIWENFAEAHNSLSLLTMSWLIVKCGFANQQANHRVLLWVEWPWCPLLILLVVGMPWLLPPL